MYRALKYNHIHVETCCFETGKDHVEYHAALHMIRTVDPFARRKVFSCALFAAAIRGKGEASRFQALFSK
jgi:hypothetical protein